MHDKLLRLDELKCESEHDAHLLMCAGFSSNSGSTGAAIMGGVRGVLPLSTFIVSGVMLDAQSATAGLKCMQVGVMMMPLPALQC